MGIEPIRLVFLSHTEESGGARRPVRRTLWRVRPGGGVQKGRPMAAPTEIRCALLNEKPFGPNHVGAAIGRVIVPYPMGLKIAIPGVWGHSPHFVIGLSRRCVASSERYGSLTVSERSAGAFLVWQRGCRGALLAPLRLFGSFSALRKNIYPRDATAASSQNVRRKATAGRGARAPYVVENTPIRRGTKKGGQWPPLRGYVSATRYRSYVPAKAGT